MNPSLKLAFDELFRKFDEIEARWERRFSPPKTKPQETTEALRIGDGEEFSTTQLVVADNWGDLFVGGDDSTTERIHCHPDVIAPTVPPHIFYADPHYSASPTTASQMPRSISLELAAPPHPTLSARVSTTERIRLDLNVITPTVPKPDVFFLDIATTKLLPTKCSTFCLENSIANSSANLSVAPTVPPHPPDVTRVLKPGPDVSLRLGFIADLGQTPDPKSTLTHYEEHSGDALLFVGGLSYTDPMWLDPPEPPDLTPPFLAPPPQQLQAGEARWFREATATPLVIDAPSATTAKGFSFSITGAADALACSTYSLIRVNDDQHYFVFDAATGSVPRARHSAPIQRLTLGSVHSAHPGPFHHVRFFPDAARCSALLSAAPAGALCPALRTTTAAVPASWPLDVAAELGVAGDLDCTSTSTTMPTTEKPASFNSLPPTKCSVQVHNSKSCSSLLHTSPMASASSLPIPTAAVMTVAPFCAPAIASTVGVNFSSNIIVNQASLNTKWVFDEVPHKQLRPPHLQYELQGDSVQMVVCVTWVPSDECDLEFWIFKSQHPWPSPTVPPLCPLPWPPFSNYAASVQFVVPWPSFHCLSAWCSTSSVHKCLMQLYYGAINQGYFEHRDEVLWMTFTWEWHRGFILPNLPTCVPWLDNVEACFLCHMMDLIWVQWLHKSALFHLGFDNAVALHHSDSMVGQIDVRAVGEIVPIAERFGMDTTAVLDNIIHARAYTYEHQYNLLLCLAAKMAEEPVRLQIVDSVIALFCVDFNGRGELAECQQKLVQMLSCLTKPAEFNAAVYMTNQVIVDPGGGLFITNPKHPAGGDMFAHAATIRLMLMKDKGEQHVCKIFEAPNFPEGEAVFQIVFGRIPAHCKQVHSEAYAVPAFCQKTMVMHMLVDGNLLEVNATSALGSSVHATSKYIELDLQVPWDPGDLSRHLQTLVHWLEGKPVLKEEGMSVHYRVGSGCQDSCGNVTKGARPSGGGIKDYPNQYVSISSYCSSSSSLSCSSLPSLEACIHLLCYFNQVIC